MPGPCGLTVALGLLFGAETARGQSISGTLTDAGTGLPLSNAPGEPKYGIAVYNTQGGVVASLAAGPDGTYQTIALFPGTYFVKGYDIGGSYVTELHSDISCVADDCVVTAGTPVVLSSTSRSSSISRSPARGVSPGRCAGRAAVTPLAGVYIYLYNAAGSPVRGITEAAVRTASDGNVRRRRPRGRCLLRPHRCSPVRHLRGGERHRRALRRPAVPEHHGRARMSGARRHADRRCRRGDDVRHRFFTRRRRRHQRPRHRRGRAGAARRASDRIYRRPHGRDRRDLVRRVRHSRPACRYLQRPRVLLRR